MFHADGADQARFLPGMLVVVRMDGSRSGNIQLELD